jgi:hypothetical protein
LEQVHLDTVSRLREHLSIMSLAETAEILPLRGVRENGIGISEHVFASSLLFPSFMKLSLLRLPALLT